VIFGIVFTIILAVATIPPIVAGALMTDDVTTTSISLPTSLIISGSIMGFMLLLQYYPIHRAIFRGIPTRRSLSGDGATFVFISMMAMLICVIDIAWSAVRISSAGVGTTIKNLVEAYAIIGILASVAGIIVDFSFIFVYVGRY
jgi:hypothetical protein